MIRTCLFDLGNVLVRFSPVTMYGQIGALCGRSAEEIRDLFLHSGLQEDFETGRISAAEFHQKFQDALSVTIDPGEMQKAGSEIFSLIEPMPALLDALKARGHRLVLMSNTSVTHFEFIRDRFDVLSRFDRNVLSYEVGAVKPQPAIFQAAIEAIECSPADCFYTDDIAEYVTAARTFGFQAEVFRDPATLLEQLSRYGVDLPTLKKLTPPSS